MMELGISSYTYVWWAGVPGYAAPREPLTPGLLLETAGALGVRVVQMADNLPLDGFSERELEDLGGAARALGIAIELGTRGIHPEILHRHLRIAGALGSSLLRTLLDSPGHEPSEEEAATMLRAIAPEFERAGVLLAVENHDRFPAVSLRRIIESAGSAHVGVCLDTANSLGCGECAGQVIDRLGDLVVNLHVKDFLVRRLPHHKGFVVEGAPAGQGLLKIPEILDRLKQYGRDCNVILEQWPPPEETIEASIQKEKAWAEESLRYLRTVEALRNDDRPWNSESSSAGSGRRGR
jgi:sugar phosphate isomerase/epimerase